MTKYGSILCIIDVLLVIIFQLSISLTRGGVIDTTDRKFCPYGWIFFTFEFLHFWKCLTKAITNTQLKIDGYSFVKFLKFCENRFWNNVFNKIITIYVPNCFIFWPSSLVQSLLKPLSYKLLQQAVCLYLSVRPKPTLLDQKRLLTVSWHIYLSK